MIDNFKIISQQPWLLVIIIPVLLTIGYMAVLLIKQMLRLFTEKPPYNDRRK